MEEMNSLKDIINVKCDLYKDRVAFLEKDGKNPKYEEITYAKVKEDVNALGTVMLENLKLRDLLISKIKQS